MARYFFDTSALVKLYHREPGTDLVEGIAQASGSTILIARLSCAELISAFAIKVRTFAMGRPDAEVLLRQFQADIVDGTVRVSPIGNATFGGAERLVAQYGFDLRLRALDALQLAAAVELRESGGVDYFVSADRVQCGVAALEGFQVINSSVPDFVH